MVLWSWNTVVSYSNPAPPHKPKAGDVLFVSEMSGWHIKFKNSSSSRVLYSSAADPFGCAQVFTQTVNSEKKTLGSSCYAGRKWVNLPILKLTLAHQKNGISMGRYPTSNQSSKSNDFGSGVQSLQSGLTKTHFKTPQVDISCLNQQKIESDIL